MPKQEPPITFRGKEIEEWLALYQPTATTSGSFAKDMLEWFKLALPSMTAEIHLDQQELMLIMDAMNGIITFPHDAGYWWINVEDAIKMDKSDEKWGVDGKALIQKLQTMPPYQSIALILAVRRWWNGAYQMEDPTESLKAVGLLR